MSQELSAAEFDVLNTVVLKKLATAGQVADVVEGDVQEVSELFSRLEAAGLLAVVDGQALPTDAAVPAVDAFAADAYGALRARADVAAACERFERINARFLEAMQAWQQVEIGGQAVANDHSDPAYDAKVIDSINSLVDRLDAVMEVLAAEEPRFARYGRRFTAALARVDGGEIDYVSSPQVDSVHNIWFELHEDLLRTLGKERRE